MENIAVVTADPAARARVRPIVASPLRGVLVALFLLFEALAHCAPAMAQGTEHLSSDPLVAGARALLELERFDEALYVLRNLPADHPDRTDIRFLIGLAAIGAAERTSDVAVRIDLLDEAIAALRAILVEAPQIVRVRLELARAFFLKEDDDLAREHFERVLAGRPPAPVVANVQRFLDIIRQRRRWSAHMGVALAPDSNIGSASGSRTIIINGLEFVRDANSLPASGFGLLLWAGGEYEQPVSPTIHLRSGANASIRQYSGQAHDETKVSAHIGPRVLVDADTDLSVLGTLNQEWAGGDPTIRDTGVRVEVNHRFAPQFSGEFNAALKQRRDRGGTGAKDGPIASFALGGLWRLSPSVSTNLSFGLTQEKTDTVRLRNDLRWMRTRVNASLPAGFSLGVSGELHARQFEGNWFPYIVGEESRRDLTRIAAVSLHNRALDLFGFSPEVALVREVRDSNAALHDYQKNRAELRFVRLY